MQSSFLGSLKLMIDFSLKVLFGSPSCAVSGYMIFARLLSSCVAPRLWPISCETSWDCNTILLTYVTRLTPTANSRNWHVTPTYAHPTIPQLALTSSQSSGLEVNSCAVSAVMLVGMILSCHSSCNFCIRPLVFVTHPDLSDMIGSLYGSIFGSQMTSM